MSKVSVIIPTYGKPVFLEKSIQSVLNQSYQDFELIIVDDNDPNSVAREATQKIIQGFSDVRLKYIMHPYNKNGAAARNTGIADAIGEYISFLDSDDEYMPDRLAKCVAEMENASPEIAGVYSGCEFRKGGKPYNKFIDVSSGNFIVETLACTFMFCSGSNIFVRKSVIDELCGFDESFLRHQDYEFLVRLFRKYSLIAIPEMLIIKNNENFNLPELNKSIAIKKQYLNRFIKDIEQLPLKSQNYIYHCNAVAVGESAIKLRKYGVALKYYHKAIKRKFFSGRELMRMAALFLQSIIIG